MPSRLNNEMSTFVRHLNGGSHSRVEFQTITLNPIAEYDPIPRHLGFEGHWLYLGDLSVDNGGSGRAAGEGLSDGMIKSKSCCKFHLA